MNKFLSYTAAAALSIGVIGASLQTADAGQGGRDRFVGGVVGFAAGALIGSAIASQPRVVYGPRYYGPRHARRIHVAPRRVSRRRNFARAHARWCVNTYRSYRRWDNTFQPYRGARQACLSPYN